jgi:iron(III) transport system permease protein
MGRRDYRKWTIVGLLAVLGVLASLPLLLGSDARSRLLAANSLYLAACTCAVALPWGTVLAALLARSDTPGRRPAMILMGAMLFIPLYLQAAGWLAGFGMGGWYTWLSGTVAGEPLLYGWRGAIWVHALAALPWVTLIVSLGLVTIPPEWEESALLDGTPWQVFRHVTLRHAWGSVGIAALWILVMTAGEMTVTDIFQLRTYAEELYTGYALGDDLYAAPLQILPGVIIVAWLTIAALVVCLYVVPPQDLSEMRPPRRYELGPWRWPAAAMVAATVLVLIGVPLGNLLYQAGVAISEPGAAAQPSWSLTHCVRVIGESGIRHGQDFRWTILTGTMAASVATVLAIAVAWPARSGGSRLLPLLAVTAVCLAVPGPLVGMGLVDVFTQPFAPILYVRDKTILLPCAAQLVRSLPLATLVVWQALRTIPKDTVEMATMDGAGPWQRLLLVALPQRRAAIAAAWLVALAIAMGDVAATASQLVIPPGVDLLSRRIAGMLHASVHDQIAGICLTNWALFVVIAAAVMWLLSPRRQRSG